MPWLPITVESARAALAGAAEQDLLCATTPGQPDPLAEELGRVLAMVRSYIPSLRANPGLGAGLLPDLLHASCLDILRLRLATRLAAGRAAGEWLVTEPRRKAAEEAMSYLKDIARGIVAIEPPPDGGAPAAPIFTGEFGSDSPEAFK
jgi:hypothetical protein